MKNLQISLSKLEKNGVKRGPKAAGRKAVMEFHIKRDMREKYGLDKVLFSLTGNVVLADLRQVRELAAKFNAQADPAHPEQFVKSGQLFAMGLIDEILHYVVALYREQVQPDAFDSALNRLETKLGDRRTDDLQRHFSGEFPPRQVYAGDEDVETYLDGSEDGESHRSLSLEETLLLALANLNPAFKPFKFLFNDADLAAKTVYPAAIEELKVHFKELPPFGPNGQNLWDMLRAPALASPDSLTGQLEYMRKNWGLLISKFISRLLIGLDVIKEEEKPNFGGGPGPMEALTYGGMDEYENFSPDQDWMPRTVLMAKSTLVWLFQLSQKYQREITRLDQIPDEELDALARRGFTGLWLIGLWERSNASKTVKQWTGNPDAAASAYSLYDYDIAGELGGWGALNNLRDRCTRRGIHLGSDMVPNHTGVDSRWVMEHPDRFLQLSYPPFPGYTYSSGNLSGRDGITVQIEDHYYTRTDAAVVFKRIDHSTGEVRYIYHGNDGTSMPWNDTAQIDFLNPEAREAVIRTIIGVCQQFPIVRFDAAMTLAKKHIQRLWYPEPGRGGDIASRAEHALTNEEFNRRIPNEFWREVVDRCAVEAPNTLLLAEAFWMMEGYFVRTLGMHRVYNSAFMHMLKNEDNAKYRATIKNTLEYDPEILKRFVNFMNNPDEETAVAQFGKGDKYFGIATLLVTMPGLPMFGHGQIEGFEEKYGMEYRRSYKDEKPDGYLIDRHEREIFPLMKRRALFSGSASFRIYDLSNGGAVNENVFAYSNRLWDEKTLVFYNNSYYEASGWIHQSSPAIPQDDGTQTQDSLSEALSIHGDGRYFTLFREQRSNLWFIRSSKEISERGLFVALKGYEAQVFLDIYDVEDIHGRWARLNHDLNGRGVPDPEAAIQDIFLGELYYRFMELLRPEQVEKIHRFFTPDSGTSAANLIASFHEPVKIFIETARHFIGGAEGQYDPWVPPAADSTYSTLDVEMIAKEYESYIGRLLEIAGYADLISPADKPAEIKFLVHLASRIRQTPAIIAFALGYGALALLRPVIGKEASGADAAYLAAGHWRLDRKLREVFRAQGISDNESRRSVEMMFALLAKTVPADNDLYKTTGPFKAGTFASVLIQEHYQDEDFRRLLGINLFEDVTWFNKEGFEAALFYSSYFFTLESDKALGQEKPLSWIERVNRIAETVDTLTKAEDVSEFRLDYLLDALSGGKKPAAKTADSSGKKKTDNKAAGAKKPAKKSTEGAGKKKAGDDGKKPAAKSTKTTKGKTKK
ncbi:MAG: alpha-amylase [Treponema sp.]|jgi:glycosidase|nr:alpha-amylase [Treponema sp.]